MRPAGFVPMAAFLGLLVTPALMQAQHKWRPADDIARSYNDTAPTIQDEIDTIRKQLDKPNLSMAEASRLIERQSALGKKADDLWKSTQSAIDDSFRKTRDSINEFNSANNRLQLDTTIVGSKVDLLNNVAKYPIKDDFEKNKAQMSQDWDKNYGSRLKPFGEDFAQRKDELFKQAKDRFGVDLNAEGYSRIGTSNPYTGEVYYKYYGPDGKLVAGQWKSDSDGWAKWQQDVEASRRRQRDLKEQLDKQGAGLKDFQGQFDNSRKNLGGKVDSLLADAKRKQTENPFRVGQNVDVWWGDRWWDGQIRQVNGNRYFITYPGYDSSWDEWVGPTRIRAR